MEKEIKVFNNFTDQEKADIEYYRKLDPDKKIEELEFIRESFLNMINATPEERRLQYVIKVYHSHKDQEEDDNKIFEEFRSRIAK
ncbi:MAG: hypothetical protein ABIY50_05590 [Ignavibacteria bacterium]